MIISFLGDISFNDDYIKLFDENVNPFADVQCYLEDTYVIGNLECTAKGDDGENLQKKPRLKTDIPVLDYLKTLNVSIVSLANNHVYDNLKSGFEKTVKFLDNNQIEYFGAASSGEDVSKPIYIEEDGIKVVVLTYVTEDTNPTIPESSGVRVNSYNKDKVLNDINKYKDICDHLVLFLHWGGIMEGSKYPHYQQIVDSRQFVKEGAGLIIGHHSHTLQPFEKRKDKYIFYSLGNFCFADIHFEGKVRNMISGPYKYSLIVKTHFNKYDYSIELIPIKNEDLHIKYDKGSLLKLKTRNFFFLLISLKPCWYIYFMIEKYIKPVWKQLLRKDAEKPLIQRIAGLNREKIRQLFKH